MPSEHFISVAARRNALIIALVIGLFLLGGSTARPAVVVNFDPPDLPPTTSFAAVPSPDHGLNWTNFFYINKNYLAGSGYDHGTVSAPNDAFNGFGQSATVIDPTGFFDFNSAFLTAAWIPGLQVQVDGYNTNFSSTPLFTKVVTVAPAGPTPFSFANPATGAFIGVNKLVFTSYVNAFDPPNNPAGVEFAMDDFTFTVNPNGATPEPGTFLLAAVGGVGLWLGRRRHCK